MQTSGIDPQAQAQVQAQVQVQAKSQVCRLPVLINQVGIGIEIWSQIIDLQTHAAD